MLPQTPARIDAETDRPQRPRNETASISSVPPEIVADIMMFYTRLYRPTRRRCLVTITRISSYIREIAITYPPLWTNISLCARKEWNELCLNRSKTAALHIHATDGPSDVARGTLTMLQEHRSRFKLVSVSGSSWIRDIWFEGPLPRLEKLIVRCTSTSRHFDLLDGVCSTPINTLRHIELDNCKFSWTAEGLCINENLTYLSIHLSTEQLRAQPWEILVVLVSTPNLQSLSLWGTIRDGALVDEPRPSFPEVHLPRLTRMSVRNDKPSTLFNFISHIHHPPSAKLDFACKPEQLLKADPTLDLFISHALRGAITRHIVDFNLSYDESSSVLSLRYAEDLEESIRVTFQCADFSSKIIPAIRPSILLNAALSLPLHSVKVLTVTIDTVNTSRLLEVLGRMPNTQTLIIHGNFESFSQMVEKILPTCASRGKRPGGRRRRGRNAANTYYDSHSCTDCTSFVALSLANLQHLRLVRGDMKFELRKALSKYLAFRQQIGRPLATLGFERCWRIDAGVVQGYRGYVGTVEWDGVIEGATGERPQHDLFDIYDAYDAILHTLQSMQRTC
ncbi:hypothetical protein AX16_002599 [Volvariella volvacea WC 439]|nr:hypothetical protein AX16_002599 [Volvariella volvacea WC 439]